MNELHKDSLTLTPSKAKIYLLIIFCLVFIAIGVVAVRAGESTSWVVIIFFGTGIVLMLLRLLPGADYLKLETDGFTVKTLLRTEQFKWSDIEQFQSAIISRYEKVIFTFKEEYTENALGRKVSKFITGTEGVLPDTYGKSTDELAELLNAWKNEHA